MPWKRDHDRRLLRFARSMRREQTDAEKRLWHLLRAGRLAGFKFRRQHPVGGYIVDFYCLKSGLVVEADGGHHRDPEGKHHDECRTKRLSQMGIRVIRFSDVDILKHSDAVVQAIYKALTAPPIPSPGTPGEG